MGMKHEVRWKKKQEEEEVLLLQRDDVSGPVTQLVHVSFQRENCSVSAASETSHMSYDYGGSLRTKTSKELQRVSVCVDLKQRLHHSVRQIVNSILSTPVCLYI